MIELEQTVIVSATLLFPPLLLLVSLTLLLATFGKSLGIRKRYVQLLVALFEWGAKLYREKTLMRERELGWTLDSEEEDSDEEASSHSSLIASHSSLVPNEESAAEYAPDAKPRTHSQSQLIEREASQHILEVLRRGEKVDPNDKVWGVVNDSLEFIKAGMESIIEDQVTSRFDAEELTSWNMLTRTAGGHTFVSYRLTAMWALGCFIRYLVLFPARLIILAVGLTFLVVTTAAVGYVPEGPWKKRLNRTVSLMAYRILCRSVSAIITYHNEENQAQPGGICVANHTSPIDVCMLSHDNCYALVGQKHGGLFGLIQRALNRASSHIWFERAVAGDRAAVARRLREHVQDPTKLPILIFPEGTCINNTSVMQFKKGSFECADVIYPVAIKYDPKFGDPFWNSSKQSAVEYLVMMMTSWAIVAEVWYLAPMRREEGEDAIAFANRVKAAIAKAGGLVDLEWDGQLKRYPVSDKMIAKQRELYSRRLATRKDQ